MNNPPTTDVSIRTLTVTLTSHLNDVLWAAARDEITECIEQIACDYAATCVNDQYSVFINDGLSIY